MLLCVQVWPAMRVTGPDSLVSNRPLFLGTSGMEANSPVYGMWRITCSGEEAALQECTFERFLGTRYDYKCEERFYWWVGGWARWVGGWVGFPQSPRIGSGACMGLHPGYRRYAAGQHVPSCSTCNHTGTLHAGTCLRTTAQEWIHTTTTTTPGAVTSQPRPWRAACTVAPHE